MNAVCLYVSTAQLVLQTDNVNRSFEQRLLDLNRLLPNLRQLLTCVVCCRLLKDPYTPQDNSCQHNVCRLCVRGRKSLRPICNICKDCEDFKTYNENRQMRCLLLCYKSLCEHIMASAVFTQLSKQKPTKATINTNPGIPLPNMSTQELVLEGASYDEILNKLNDLPRPIPVRVQLASASISAQKSLTASAVTSITPIASTHIVTSVQTAPKPIVVNAATTAMFSAPTLLKHERIIPVTAMTSAAQTQTQTQMQMQPQTQPQTHTKIQPQIQTHIQKQTQTQTLTQTLPTQPQALTIRHLKSIIDLSSAVQVPAATINASSITYPTSTPTITYVGPNTPGIVVPIVSSSGTTTAPLTIASAKLQSLNRQLAQVRNTIGVTPATLASVSKALSVDVVPPLTFKVSLAANAPSTTTDNTAITTTATITSNAQMRNPPPIKTVSNGSAMYSVLYTGIGNKITIKRKTDGDEDAAQRKNALTAMSTAAIFRQLPTKLNPRRRGCRCGNATPTPGKLTCCGQRCPCYVDSKSCIGCKCRGCRNPHRPDGGKVRPIIPELACYEIQMADENSSLSPNELPIVAGTQSIEPVDNDNSIVQQQQTHQTVEEYIEEQPATPAISLTNTSCSSTHAATLIPFRNFHHITAMAQQQTRTLANTISGNHQPLHGTTGVLQRESVLIQSPEGKYQVVNVFTTGTPNAEGTNQISGLQRIHTISQLQMATNNTTVNSLSSLGNTFLLPSGGASTTVVPTTNMTTMPQIIIQQQQTRNTGVGNCSIGTTSLPLQQLHQQIKQNNIITVHPITGNHAVSAVTSSTQSSTMPLISTPTATPTTVTLSPIMVTSPNNFVPDLFSSDSSEGFISLDNTDSNIMSMSNASDTHIVTVPTPQTTTSSPLSFGSSNGTGATHLTTAMIEMIDSSDL